MNQEPQDSFELLLKRRLASETPSGKIVDACPDENWMAAYLEHAQSERQKAEFEKHLLKCNRCQAELALLIKTGAMTEDSIAPAIPVKPQVEIQKRRPWSWFGWMAPAIFRPVFAILVISVISAVLGYRLIREPAVNAPSEQSAQPLSQESPPSFAESNPGNSRSSLDSPERGEISGQGQGKKESSNELHSAAKSAAALPASSAPVRQQLGGEFRRNRTDALSDSYAVEGPPVVPSKSEESKTLSEARELNSPPPSTESVIAPGSDLKKEASKDELARQSLPAQLMVGAAGRVQELETAQDKPHPVKAPSLSAIGALSKNDSNEKKERDAEPAVKLSGMMKRKQEQPITAGRAAGLVTSSSQRIETGGKSFELRNNVWTDLSIREEELAKATLILVPSPEFDRLREALLAFQPILSHPQDTLIKQNNRVYRISKARR